MYPRNGNALRGRYWKLSLLLWGYANIFQDKEKVNNFNM